jgi:hypothetical protein
MQGLNGVAVLTHRVVLVVQCWLVVLGVIGLGSGLISSSFWRSAFGIGALLLEHLPPACRRSHLPWRGQPWGQDAEVSGARFRRDGAGFEPAVVIRRIKASGLEFEQGGTGLSNLPTSTRIEPRTDHSSLLPSRDGVMPVECMAVGESC